MIDALGSPLNVVLPQQLHRNLTTFREVYRHRRLSGQIYFAHKANRSSALIRELAAGDAGVDVASLGELQHALGAGFAASRIMATGPKDRAFLWLAARTGVTVNADSSDEIEELAGIVATHGLNRLRVTVRLSGFSAPGIAVLARRSRFGTPATALPALLDVMQKYSDELELAGVAYHLDTLGMPEKAAALEECLTALDTCRDRGLRPWTIDIGGGYGVNYLADRGQWERYTSELTGAVLGRRTPLTWDGHGYGLRNEGGKVRGTLGLYPAYRPVAGAAYLDALLDTTAPGLGRPLGDLLLDSMNSLDIEPGRALLDQCGLVLAEVLEVRDEPGGDTLVRLGCNAGDVSLEEHGVLMDPVVIHRSGPADERPAGVYLLGNLCLEADLITRRKVFLPSRPRPGDLLAFVNTAGYFMDFNAGAALRQPLARTVTVHHDDGAWRWCLDEKYWPVRRRRERQAA
ncbi:Y4yA family PLP-dependent enzyme [Micromonosporaceae bacterium Da 78-11]